MDATSQPTAERSVRIRGIYTTAATARLLDAGFAVVQPSPAIRERFAVEFADGPATATVETDEAGIALGVHGSPSAVSAVVDHLAVGRDALCHTVLPEGSLYRGVIAERTGSGWIVDLGDGEALLPDRSVEGSVQTGETVLVRIDRSPPPWVGRPIADTTIAVAGGLASLVRGGSAPDPSGPDLRTLVTADPPEGWAIRWNHGADVDRLDALTATIEVLAERARAIDDALESDTDDTAPRAVWTDRASRWLRLGREGRLAFDDDRREVTPTVPGHHRIKAGGRAAGRAVDFLEAIPGATGGLDEPPIAAAMDAFGPDEGDRVAITHDKPDGRSIDLGTGTVTAREATTIELEREMHSSGTYDGLGTPRAAGDVATSTYREGRWWAPTVYESVDGEYRGTYVNVSTPIELFPETVRYVDLHVDVVKRPDGTIERVDEDVLQAAVEDGQVTDRLADRARSVAEAVESAL